MLTCDVAKIVPTPQKVPIVGATNVSALLLPKPPQFRALNPHWRAVIAAACHSVPFFYALFSFPFLARIFFFRLNEAAVFTACGHTIDLRTSIASVHIKSHAS